MDYRRLAQCAKCKIFALSNWPISFPYSSMEWKFSRKRSSIALVQFVDNFLRRFAFLFRSKPSKKDLTSFKRPNFYKLMTKNKMILQLNLPKQKWVNRNFQLPHHKQKACSCDEVHLPFLLHAETVCQLFHRTEDTPFAKKKKTKQNKQTGS